MTILDLFTLYALFILLWLSLVLAYQPIPTPKTHWKYFDNGRQIYGGYDE